MLQLGQGAIPALLLLLRAGERLTATPGAAAAPSSLAGCSAQGPGDAAPGSAHCSGRLRALLSPGAADVLQELLGWRLPGDRGGNAPLGEPEPWASPGTAEPGDSACWVAPGGLPRQGWCQGPAGPASPPCPCSSSAQPCSSDWRGARRRRRMWTQTLRGILDGQVGPWPRGVPGAGSAMGGGRS